LIAADAAVMALVDPLTRGRSAGAFGALKRDIIGQFDVAEEVRASENSVDAAVAALGEALAHALTTIVTWALTKVP
jgi:hypothetical protein